MSTTVCFLGEFAKNVSIEADNSDPCIWIRSRHENIALTLTPSQRADVRAALDAIDARAGGAVQASYEAALAAASAANVRWGPQS